MGKTRYLLTAVSAGAAVAAALATHMARAAPRSWANPYQPTRLEWLVHEANAAGHSHCEMSDISSSGTCTGIVYVPRLPATVIVAIEARRVVTSRDSEAVIAVRKARLDTEVEKGFQNARDIIALLARKGFDDSPPKVELNRHDSTLSLGAPVR